MTLLYDKTFPPQALGKGFKPGVEAFSKNLADINISNMDILDESLEKEAAALGLDGIGMGGGNISAADITVGSMGMYSSNRPKSSGNPNKIKLL